MARKKKTDSAAKQKQTFKCTQCNRPLTFQEHTIIVNDRKNAKAPIAYCSFCRRYYTNDKHFQNQKISFKDQPVRSLTLNPVVKRKKIISQYKSYEQKRIKDLQRETKIFKQQQFETRTPEPESEIPNFVKDNIFLQIPTFQNATRSCPYCSTSFRKMFPIRYYAFQENEPTIMYTHARACMKCKVVLMDENRMDEVRRQANGKNIFTLKAESYQTPQALMNAVLEYPKQKLENSKNSTPLPFDKDIERIENLSSIKRHILIYAHNCHCHTCNKKYQTNTIRNRTAVVQTISGETINVNVMFCAGCGRYYMNLKAFEEYRKVYKGLLFECVFSADIPSKDSAWFGFAPDSILSRCGYNVKAQTSEDYRRAVLRYILDSGKATKYEIIEKLSDFIELRVNRANMSEAIEKWAADIHYVSQYQISQQQKVYGLEFKQGGKYRR